MFPPTSSLILNFQYQNVLGKMKTTAALSLVLLTQLNYCVARSSLTAVAISKFVEKHLEEDSFRFEFFIQSSIYKDLLEDVLKKCNSSEPYQIASYKINNVFVQEHIVIFFYESFDVFFRDYTNRTVKKWGLKDEFRMQSLIYCNKTNSSLIEKKFQDHQSFLQAQSQNKFRRMNIAIQLLTFLMDEDGEISLKVLTMFTATKCGVVQLVEINKFSKTSRKWTTNKFHYPEVDNYQGCRLNILVPQNRMPISHCVSIKPYRVMDNRIKKNYTCKPSQINTQGLLPWIVKSLEKSLNFSKNYVKCLLQNGYHLGNDFMCECLIDFVLFVPESGDFTIKLRLPKVYSIFTDTTNHHVSAPLYFDFYTFVIPPGVEYTPIEKMLLPFDFLTWVLFLAVFAISYFVIFFILMFADREVAKFVFGENVTTPSLNIFVIFMGLGLIQLPRRNFGRFLVMSYILYCLVMRFGIKRFSCLKR